MVQKLLNSDYFLILEHPPKNERKIEEKLDQKIMSILMIILALSLLFILPYTFMAISSTRRLRYYAWKFLLKRPIWRGKREQEEEEEEETRDHNGHKYNNMECAVCLSKLEEWEEMRELRCGHLYHKACLDGWFGAHYRATCPLCRSPVTHGAAAQVDQGRDCFEELIFEVCLFIGLTPDYSWFM